MVLGILVRFKHAGASFGKALSLDPNDVDAWTRKRLASKQLKRYEEAVAAYDRAIQLDPRNGSAFAEKRNFFH